MTKRQSRLKKVAKLRKKLYEGKISLSEWFEELLKIS